MRERERGIPPKITTITTTTITAMSPPLLRLKEEPVPEAPASVSTALPSLLLSLLDIEELAAATWMEVDCVVDIEVEEETEDDTTATSVVCDDVGSDVMACAVVEGKAVLVSVGLAFKVTVMVSSAAEKAEERRKIESANKDSIRMVWWLNCRERARPDWKGRRESAS